VSALAAAVALVAAGGVLLLGRAAARGSSAAGVGLGRSGLPEQAGRPGARGWAVGGLVVVSAIVVLQVEVGPVAIAAMVVVVGVAAAERARTRRARQRRATAELVEECVAVLSAELRAGRSASAAWAGAADVAPGLLSPAAQSAALGGDPTHAMRTAAATPGADTLRDVAAAWTVAQSTGAPLADLLGRAAALAKDDAVTLREVEEQLAPVRATARVLAVLPVLGLLLGGALGVDVVSLLLRSGWGQLCLLAAAALVATGLWVLERVAQRARRAA